MKQQYKLIAFDMDGTLLDSRKQITTHVQKAIADAVQAGRQVALSTGRSLSELKPYNKELGNVRYYILESGALVYDSFTDQVLLRKYFTEKERQAIVSVLFWPDTDVILNGMSRGQAYFGKELLNDMAHYNMALFRPGYEECRMPINDQAHFFATHPDNFEKINILCTSTEERERIHQRLTAECPEISYANSEISNLECTPAGITKAAGIEALCEHLGITIDKVIGVGDADNDLDMLHAVGLPIAMGNANTNVKKAARVTVADNDHDGTAEAIYHYLLS